MILHCYVPRLLALVNHHKSLLKSYKEDNLELNSGACHQHTYHTVHAVFIFYTINRDNSYL